MFDFPKDGKLCTQSLPVILGPIYFSSLPILAQGVVVENNYDLEYKRENQMK